MRPAKRLTAKLVFPGLARPSAGPVTDLKTLQAQLADLQAKVAALTPAAPPLVAQMAVPYREEPRPTPIYTLVGAPESGRQHRDPREVRRLIETVALTHGVLSPAQHVPQS